MYTEIESFSKRYDTYIIAYCPDIKLWFTTNERGFYYESDQEFNNNDEAYHYFRNHVNDFREAEHQMMIELGQPYTGDVALEAGSEVEIFSGEGY